MEQEDFRELKMEFISASVEDKIKMYVTAKGLTMSQYKELLRIYPYSELEKLEKALA